MLTQHLKLPDLWQQDAVQHLRAGHDVIVSAPTGAGKTYVFELLVKANHYKRQVVYTVPTRALANDKHAEWKKAGWKVGLATGDISDNVHAPVLVATLETQLERLIRGEGPALLVMDEYQMIADAARGSHYEAAIILAGGGTQLLLLSGSVENPDQVAEWMRRLGREVSVVTTRERPVPLQDVPIETLPQKYKKLDGWWPKLAASALVADLAPLLIFAPRRRDAENIAAKLASHLPAGEPLGLTAEQRALAGKDFTAMLEKRVACHHSGLSYGLRAGLIEPLAKAGQLRVIVSTMGLAAGINFSVRSVHVAATHYHDGVTEQQLTADELLQMFGRAGRRGLDDNGYVLTTRDSPSLSDARPARIHRSTRLNWPLFIRIMRQASQEQKSPFDAAQEFAQRLFAKAPPDLGLGGTEQQTETRTAPAAGSQALFGLKGTRKEWLNSAGEWEPMPGHESQEIPLSDTWYSREGFQGPTLSSTRWVGALASGLGRLFKLEKRGTHQYYGKELALGTAVPDDANKELLTPTQALRKLLQIPRHIQTINQEKLQTVALPKLAAHFPGAQLVGTAWRQDLLWAQFDYSPMLVKARKDALGRWLTEADERTLTREEETSLKTDADAAAHTSRPGSAIHAWRTLGLIESDGAPTRRGVIFSFFQHGEGLAIAAALEDASYPVEELVFHLANLRSDCRFDYPIATASERLGAICRSTYGFVNHTGYLEAGLPVGYGEGTAELLHLVDLPTQNNAKASGVSMASVSEGDLARAKVEWLSLLRHIIQAPPLEWERWLSLKCVAQTALDAFAPAAGSRRFPELTPKQMHERPRHYLVQAEWKPR